MVSLILLRNHLGHQRKRFATQDRQHARRYLERGACSLLGLTLALTLRRQHFFHPRRLEAILALGRKRVDSGSGPVPEFDPLIEATTSRLTRSTSTQDLAAASKALVLKSRMVISDKKRAMEKLLEPIMSSNGDVADKGKARWESDMRHRLFIVGF